jgi:hypothetical protein
MGIYSVIILMNRFLEMEPNLMTQKESMFGKWMELVHNAFESMHD